MKILKNKTLDNKNYISLNEFLLNNNKKSTIGEFEITKKGGKHNIRIKKNILAHDLKNIYSLMDLLDSLRKEDPNFDCENNKNKFHKKASEFFEKQQNISFGDAFEMAKNIE